jgi:GT2 family glycosyltransferase
MVSVIIPNWNGRNFIEGCLVSLRGQTFQDLEIIMIDNGSSDGSIELVKGSFPEVKVISLTYNKGFSGAVNEGIKKAKGEFIALLNNDTIADSRWIEELVKEIDSSKAIGCCASRILRSIGTGIDTAGDTYTRYGVAIKRGYDAETKRFLQKELVFGACGGAALYRRSMLEEIGSFDEDFFCVYEDVDMSFRAQLLGFKCLYVPTAIVSHYVGGTAGTKNDFTLYYGQRNMEYVFLKNMPLPLLVKYLPLHIEYVVLAFLYYLLKNQGGIYLRSKMDAFKQIRLTLQKRKEIQRKRRVSSSYLETIMNKRSLFKHIVSVV